MLAVLLLAPLAVRRRWPAACLVAVAGVALVQWLAVRRTSRHIRPTSPHVLVGAFLASTVVAEWTIGVLQRVRMQQEAGVAERARLLEVEREQRDLLAVQGERRRIARDMHDVVAHALAGVIAQADGARYSGSPEVGAVALDAIGRHARQALTETRRVLGVLRDDAGDPSGAPQPGIADLAALVDDVRALGLDVRFECTVPADELDPGLSVTVYRIVQQGLTNVLKHAGPTLAEVVVTGAARSVVVEVRDEGPVAGAPVRPVPGGYGLLGMRERAAAYGGTISSEPLAGGHVLRAQLPVPR